MGLSSAGIPLSATHRSPLTGRWGLSGHLAQIDHELHRRPPAGHRSDLCGRNENHGYVCEEKSGEAWVVTGHSPQCHLSPSGLWLGMLACVLLAAAAFIVYTARMNWKLAAEEVSQQPLARSDRSAERPRDGGPQQQGAVV